MVKFRKPFKLFAYLITAVVVLALLGVSIYYLVKHDKQPRGVVVTNGYTCAKIGASILSRGGSAVDATIASLFCEGVSMPHSMGLGGGFIMTIYSKVSGTSETLNARESAPKLANESMFHGDSDLSTKGGQAVAVPGDLRGYWEAYKKYGGKLPWKDLVQPTIDMCKEGIYQTSYLARTHGGEVEQLKKDPTLRDTFIDPRTNFTYLEGQRVKRLRLAKTLELIAEGGADVLYNGTLTKQFVQDIQDNGGLITEEDINNYQPEWQQSVQIDLPFDQVLFSAPPPGSGVILGFMFNTLNGFLDYAKPQALENWQKIVETFKFAYARRTELGDLKFDTSALNIKGVIAELTSGSYARDIRKRIYVNQTSQDATYYGAKAAQMNTDHGTAHVCVVAPNGDAVSVTSTINLYFGAGFMSNSTGIILNDEMDDFASPNITNNFDIPPSVANFIKPGKRPLSSMSPSIFVDKNDGSVQLVIGAAGGTKITTAVALIGIRNLWYNETIQDAVDDKRLHHQLFPMSISFEAEYANDMEIVYGLHGIGHEYEIAEPSTGFSAVTAISRKGGTLKAGTDKRRTGDVAYVYD